VEGEARETVNRCLFAEGSGIDTLEERAFIAIAVASCSPAADGSKAILSFAS
jgi:hypothetical protein